MFFRHYRNGGLVNLRGYAAGGVVVPEAAPTAPLAAAPTAPGQVNYNVPQGNPYVQEGAVHDPVANQAYYDPNSAQNTAINQYSTADSQIDYSQLGGTGQTAVADAALLPDNYVQDYIHTSNPIDLANTDQVAPPTETIGESLVPAELGPGSAWTAGDILESNQTLENIPGVTTPEYNQDVDPSVFAAAAAAGDAPPVISQDGNVVPPSVGTSEAINSGATGNPANVVGSYIGGGGAPGVNTGIPQGGHAANAIAQYFAGTNTPQLSYNNPQTSSAVDYGQLEEFKQDFAAQSNVAQGAGQSQASFQGGFEGPGQAVQMPDGTTMTVDSQLEFNNAQQIAQNIEAGGINPETGDWNVVAGPNALSAADEGFFGIGSDYNQEFGENYDAQAAHAANNPYGQTTGTPLYDQGYAEDGDFAAGILNNSGVGILGNAITGENLVPTYDDLLPPAAAFNNDNDSGGSNANNDGDPTNDTGNSGWGFTSISDMFDGGGPGSSGDSYTGGIHGSNTVGDATDGWQPSDLGFGGGSDNDSGGGGGGSDNDGTWCCTAAFKHGMPIKKIKELRRWHKQQSQIWQDGYDTYGNWIANNLVKGSPFWSRVTEAGHTAFVERRVTPMSCLAVLVIAPGSLIVGTYKYLKGGLNASTRNVS